MSEEIVRTPRWYAELTFVALVTACLLAFVFSQATRGPAGLPGVVIYGLAAGFGLEYVSSVWTGRSARRRRSRASS